MSCKNYTDACKYERYNSICTCPCDSYEDTVTDEEFAKQLKYKVGDLVKWGDRYAIVEEVDASAHGWDNSCLPYKLVLWCSEDALNNELRRELDD